MVRIPQYLRNLRRGRVVPGRENTLLSDRGAAVRLSGNFGYGQTAGMEAVETLVERCAAHGVAAVGVSEMNHIGRLADYCAAAARQGVLTLLFGASGGFNAMVAPFGGARRRMNTNPFAVGIPTGGEPVVFDIATSAASQGMLKVALDNGETIPSGLLLDKHGAPSTNPLDYYQGGAIMPFGERQGYKGYLLNFLVEVLGGILTDGGFMGHPKREAGGQCVLFIGLRLEAFRQTPVFREELEALTRYLKETRPLPGMEVLGPGERSRRVLEVRRREGFTLPAVTVQALQEELERYALDISLSALGRAEHPAGEP